MVWAGRRGAVLGALVAVLSVSMMVQTTRTAEAFALPPLPVLLPAGLTPALVGGGAGGGAAVGAVATFGGAAGGAGAVAGGVAIAPVALAVGAVLLTGAAVYLGWRWASGGDDAGTDLDPAPAQGVGSGASWNHFGLDAYADRLSEGSIVWQSGVVYSVSFRRVSSNHDSYAAFYWGRACDGVMQATYGGVSVDNPYPEYVSFTRAFDYSSGSSCPAGQVASGFISAAGYGGSRPEQGMVFFAGADASPAPDPVPSGETSVTTVPTSQCSGGSSVAGAAVVFTGATASADLPPILAPACPAGETRTGFSTPATFPDGSDAPSPLPSWAAPVIPSAYAECQSPGSCVLTLTELAVDGQTRSCTNTGACTGWSEDSTLEQMTTRTGVGTQVQQLADGSTRTVIPRTRPDGSVMVCAWGPYVLPADECLVIPTEAPEPSVARPDVDVGCLGGWSWNPVDWVYRPIVCAAQWAFVPQSSKVDQVLGLKTELGGKVPFGYAGQISDSLSLAELDASGVCNPGPTAVVWTYTFQPLNLCDGVLHDGLVPLRPVLSAALWLSILVPFGMWLFRSSVPVIGHGEAS